jgi:hypothetical protein
MSVGSRITRRLLGTAVVVLAAASGSASAQTAPPPWNLYGSDTLFDIMTQSIANAQAKGVPGTANLAYAGGGSGNAENQMKANVQSIGPMSRNFRPTTVTSHPNWAPAVRNVVALDAAVIVSKNTARRCKNMNLPLLASDPTKAAANDNTLPFTFGTPGSGYSQLLEIVLSGTDGSGSVAACSDPKRIQALQDLAACSGIGTISHFFRRDDNSGTTDTFKDKVVVGRFCNGTAVGLLGANATNPNLNNQDLDPIRRPCPNPGTRLATTCTDMTTGLACSYADGNPNCTQGLIVALSMGDDGSTDVTTTIAARVAADATGATMGYAGREAVRQTGSPTAGIFINTNSFSDAIVRLDQYMLSRRLFLQYGNDITDLGAPTALSPAGGGGAAQLAAELSLYNYMTDPAGSASPDGAPGRCNTDPVAKAYGFIPCLDNCLLTPTGSSNLCSKTPFATVPSPPSACIPSSGAWASDGGVACAAGTTCCSTGAACPTSGVCPAAIARPTNSACSKSSECASGSCGNFIGIGINVCG